MYLMMQKSMVKLILGLILLSHAANLLIFTVGGLIRAGVPLVQDPANQAAITDPLPQALILTAIVISFGVLAFALVLILRAYQIIGTDDLDQLKATDT